MRWLSVGFVERPLVIAGVVNLHVAGRVGGEVAQMAAVLLCNVMCV